MLGASYTCVSYDLSLKGFFQANEIPLGALTRVRIYPAKSYRAFTCDEIAKLFDIVDFHIRIVMLFLFLFLSGARFSRIILAYPIYRFRICCQ